MLFNSDVDRCLSLACEEWPGDEGGDLKKEAMLHSELQYGLNNRVRFSAFLCLASDPKGCGNAS